MNITNNNPKNHGQLIDSNKISYDSKYNKIKELSDFAIKMKTHSIILKKKFKKEVRNFNKEKFKREFQKSRELRHQKELNKLPANGDCKTIAESSFVQQYGKIHNLENNHSTCMHCDKKVHEIELYSSKETNQLVHLFQKNYDLQSIKTQNSKIYDEIPKTRTMVSSAIVKNNGRIVGKYITHSGITSTGMKNIYKKMGAKVLDYTEQLPLLKQTAIEPDTLYAVHAKNAYQINHGKFKTLYGDTIQEYCCTTEDINTTVANNRSSSGYNFSNCALQKLSQQIAKDFGAEIKEHPKAFKINISEVWVGEKSEKKWSSIHPMHSCDSCVIVIPRTLCRSEENL